MACVFPISPEGVVDGSRAIAVQARSGASRAELHAVADMALMGWPPPAAA